MVVKTTHDYMKSASCNISTPTVKHTIYRSDANATWGSERWMNACVCYRQVGGKCKLSTDASQRRCRTSDGLICSGRGECVCGVCICRVSEPGMYYGPRCECHDWVCATYDGKACGGKYYYRLFQMATIRFFFFRARSDREHTSGSGMRCGKECDLNLRKPLSSIDGSFWCSICH